MKCPASKKREIVNAGNEAADNLLEIYSSKDIGSVAKANNVKVVQLLKSHLN